MNKTWTFLLWGRSANHCATVPPKIVNCKIQHYVVEIFSHKAVKGCSLYHSNSLHICLYFICTKLEGKGWSSSRKGFQCTAHSHYHIISNCELSDCPHVQTIMCRLCVLVTCLLLVKKLLAHCTLLVVASSNTEIYHVINGFINTPV